MLVSIAVSSILFLSYLVTNSTSPTPQVLQQYAPAHQCSNTAFRDVYSSMPECRPRETLVKLDLPNNPMIEEVIPSHVLVNRCSGACHEGTSYHKCVPRPGGRSTQNFEVLYSLPVILWAFLGIQTILWLFSSTGEILLDYDKGLLHYNYRISTTLTGYFSHTIARLVTGNNAVL